MHKLKQSEIEDIQNGISALVDVRSIDEFNSGHAAYAINLPLNEIDTIKIDKLKKIYVYCASGGRSQMAESALTQLGYDVTNIGGFYNAVDTMGEA